MKRLYQLIFSFRKSEFEKSVDMLIGYRSTKMVLFHTAFNHRSLKENPSENNERMEFLGDAIISSVVAEYLFKKYPYKGEGFLTEMRSKMVNRQQLNHIAIQMGLKKMTRFNKLDGGLKSSQIFGNTLEALVGAIYLDKQYDFTKKWIIEKMIQPYLFMDELEQIDINIKNKIIGWALKQGKQIDFVLADEQVEGRRRLFTINIVIDGEVITSQKGFTKKDASQIAAQKAIEILQIT
ncbi:MAG: ribonuclease III [Chitinophagaceae bacterium]|jgi:ribonuclease-3|nr:ribonuclease III [Chitinophagaceae bacterium]MCF8288838.1 ribonuclease III [Chitinophagaceae bacterium]MCF8421472.1 ribonuclease III [Chitinophagaceae bacterium]